MCVKSAIKKCMIKKQKSKIFSSMWCWHMGRFLSWICWAKRNIFFCYFSSLRFTHQHSLFKKFFFLIKCFLNINFHIKKRRFFFLRKILKTWTKKKSFNGYPIPWVLIIILKWSNLLRLDCKKFEYEIVHTISP